MVKIASAIGVFGADQPGLLVEDIGQLVRRTEAFLDGDGTVGPLVRIGGPV